MGDDTPRLLLLDVEQQEQWAVALDEGPVAYGWADACWTLAGSWR